MKRLLIIAVVFASCNSHNDQMNDLLSKKKSLEDNLEAFKARTEPVVKPIDFNDTTSITNSEFEKDVQDMKIAHKRLMVIDSFKKEVKRVEYSIDSLGKLR